MANFVSPGVYVIEKDISDYAPSINTSVVGMVGFAGKGPVNTATLITSQNNLIDTFGPPSEDLYGQALEGAIEILEQTNALYFVRAAAGTAADASANLSFGSCPSLIVSGPATADEVGASFGIGRALYLQVQVYDNSGTAKYTAPGKTFTIPAGTLDAAATGASQAKALKKVLGGDLDADSFGAYADGNTQAGLDLSGALVGAFAGSGASLAVSAWSDAIGGTAISALVPVSATAASGTGTNSTTYSTAFGTWGTGAAGAPTVVNQFSPSATVFGSTYVSDSTNASGASYMVESIYEGAGYNYGLRTDGSVSGNQIQIQSLGGATNLLNTFADGSVAEQFKLNLLASGIFLEDVLNTGETNLKSGYVKANVRRSGVDTTPAKLNQFSDRISDMFAGGYKATTRFQKPSSVDAP
jgi:hypothetical protein